MDSEAVGEHIVQWLQERLQASGQQGFAVGVSGGIDSAVVSVLCALTGAPVRCLEMPIHQPPAHVDRAQRHIAALQARFANVEGLRVDLTPVYEAFRAAVVTPDSAAGFLSLANTRSRLRMATLYHQAGLHRALVAGTGNKVEDFGVGFFTKYGDGGVDISPIGDLFKTEVYALGRALGVGEDILQAVPADGLFADDRSDEDQIGASYPELEWAMRTRAELAEGIPAGADARQVEVLAIYDKRQTQNRHKMDPIPVCMVPEELKG